MTISGRIHAQVALVALLVVGLAVADWILMPEKAVLWIVAIGTMAAAWIVVAFIGRARPFAEHSASERAFIVTSVIVAGLMLAADLGKDLAKFLGFDGGTALERWMGVAIGAFLVVLGNVLPKVLSPLTAKRCAPAQVQSIQRLAGWTFVIAGLACIAVWLLLPIEQARSLELYVVMSAAAIVIARYAWAFIAPAMR
jgi:hypothetical protein